jgi:hypothetical protein
VLDVETAVKVDEARRAVENVIEQLVRDPKKLEKLVKLLR